QLEPDARVHPAELAAVGGVERADLPLDRAVGGAERAVLDDVHPERHPDHPAPLRRAGRAVPGARMAVRAGRDAEEPPRGVRPEREPVRAGARVGAARDAAGAGPAGVTARGRVIARRAGAAGGRRRPAERADTGEEEAGKEDGGGAPAHRVPPKRLVRSLTLAVPRGEDHAATLTRRTARPWGARRRSPCTPGRSGTSSGPGSAPTPCRRARGPACR